MSEQSYTLYLGGLKREFLTREVAKGLTMSALAKKAGVRYLGYLIEYQLDEREDLIIVSLLLQPLDETKYVCECLGDIDKMPLHIFPGNTKYTLGRLSETCPCNFNFHLYSK